ncbi:hypothetical protein D3Z53_10300 [Lachnospiraceae bacterium]|jgi:UDP:flavonoid glycosyltransferase YjiC (YdhE family)|nr:hypothetical protein [uncultured Schaedlerella sp.]NBI58453.1 hypothetical protein [Lachnospiraceae bacterium]
MHIAIVSLGAFGHINPTLSLTTELVRAGHRVTYFTTEAFREIVEPTGAKFVPMKSWLTDNDKHNENKKRRRRTGRECGMSMLRSTEIDCIPAKIIEEV